MIKVVLRLEFKNVFPDKEKNNILFYLSKVSKDSLLRNIGFFNTHTKINFNNFFSNQIVQNEITERVYKYLNDFNIKENPKIISKLATLKMAETILSNKTELFKNNQHTSVDSDEFNLFVAFLLINEEINEKQVLDNSAKNNKEKLVDLCIMFTFPLSDLAIFENDDLEFLNLIYTTTIKVEQLFDFLNSKPEYENLKNKLITSYNVDNQNDFFSEMKYLFAKLLELKTSNNYLFEVEDKSSKYFLSSLISDEILVDEDFTNIKINPIYKLEENIYSIINYFFVVDKFFRSSKFKLKEIYGKEQELKKTYGDFFNFFNKEFSENFLMKNVLNDIYEKKHFVKKSETSKELKGEPDYYLRCNNNIYVFENKDVSISKSIKSSSDIKKIEEVLKLKFLGDANHSVGIGQLINTIEEILSKKFRFDNYVNSKNNLKIYPILLVHDRIFQSIGINYRLNLWYLNNVKDRLKEKYNSSTIKGLTIIDIDTLILWAPYLKEKEKNFRNIIDSHLLKINKQSNIKVNDPDYRLKLVNKHLAEQLRPIKDRKMDYKIPTSLFIDKFRNILKNK